MSPGRSSRGLRDYRRGRGHTPGTAGETVLTRLLDTPALQRHFRQSPGGARSARAAAGDHAMNRSFYQTPDLAGSGRSQIAACRRGPGPCRRKMRAFPSRLVRDHPAGFCRVQCSCASWRISSKRRSQASTSAAAALAWLTQAASACGPCPELSRTASRQIDRLLAGRSFRPQARDLSGAADAWSCRGRAP